MSYIEDLALQLSKDAPMYNMEKAIGKMRRSRMTCMIYWIIGARRIGKTDFCLRLACELYLRYHKQTMWLRNKDIELSDPAFHNDFLNDAIEFGWCPDTWKCNNTGVWDGDQQVIKFQALSTFSNRRGPAHPDVDLMILDEFCPEDRRYPKHCVTSIMSLTKSVFSGRSEARMICLSNFVSAANPYFAGLQIYPSNEDITLFPDKGMLIERCRGYNSAISKDNPWTSVYKAGRYADYQDESEDTLIDLVCRMPKRARPEGYALLIGGQFFRPYDTGKWIHWIACGKPKDRCMIYSPNITEVSDEVPLTPSLIRKNLEICVENGTVRFDSPNTLYQVMSIVYNV